MQDVLVPRKERVGEDRCRSSERKFADSALILRHDLQWPNEADCTSYVLRPGLFVQRIKHLVDSQKLSRGEKIGVVVLPRFLQSTL